MSTDATPENSLQQLLDSSSSVPDVTYLDDRLDKATDDAPAAQQMRVRPRNRNPRSCDLCRSRKTACIINDTLPCTTCRSRGLECTFAQRRRRRVQTPAPALETRTCQDESRVQSSSTDELDILYTLPFTDPAWRQGHDFLVSPHTIDDAASDSGDSISSAGSQTFRNAMELPLDQPGWTYSLLGDSGEGDPHLLKRSTQAIHANNIHFRRFPRAPDVTVAGLDHNRPIVYMLGRDTLFNNYQPQAQSFELSTDLAHLERMTESIGLPLVNLFFTHIYPSFPVLSRETDGNMTNDMLKAISPSLRAALFAITQPFMIYDDVLATMVDVDILSPQKLCHIAWIAITQEIHAPRLSTLQACLLLLQRDNEDRYVQSSPFQWSLLAWTVSLAQTLGLAVDTSTVTGMPFWERRLRKRLWWATFLLDKWFTATAGLTSHIHVDDYDVLPLSDSDCQAHTGEGVGNTGCSLGHFRSFVSLTSILSDTVTSLFTVRAMQATSSSIEATLTIIGPLKNRLENWRDAVQTSLATDQASVNRTRLDGRASLTVAFWTLHLLIHRALLRALESPAGTPQDKASRKAASQAVRSDVETCCSATLTYVEELQAGSWNAFWHKFSPSNFAIVSSVLMRLLVTSRSAEETARYNALIDRWRWVLRSGGGNGGGALMSLALLRLDRTLLQSRTSEA